MDNKIILTIGRQFGSGGREVGFRSWQKSWASAIMTRN